MFIFSPSFNIITYQYVTVLPAFEVIVAPETSAANWNLIMSSAGSCTTPSTLAILPVSSELALATIPDAKNVDALFVVLAVAVLVLTVVYDKKVGAVPACNDQREPLVVADDV